LRHRVNRRGGLKHGVVIQLTENLNVFAALRFDRISRKSYKRA